MMHKRIHIIVLVLFVYQVILAQDMTMVQIKALNQQLKPYPGLKISVNGGKSHKVNAQGLAFAEIASEQLPPKFIGIKDEGLEVESWNFSQGVLEIIVRVKTYQEVRLSVKGQQGNPVKGVAVTFNSESPVNATSNERGQLVMNLPLGVDLKRTTNFIVEGFLLTNQHFSGAHGTLTVRPVPRKTTPISVKPTPVAKPVISEVEEEDQPQEIHFEQLDSIKSLTVFYSVIKNISIDSLDDRRKILLDEKFYQLINSWEDSLRSIKSSNFLGKISDSSLVQHDVSILIEQARAEGESLDRIRDEFDVNVEILSQKLQGGGSNLSETETRQVLDGIALLSRILDENEAKFYQNQAQFRKILATLASSLRSISDLEDQLVNSEDQRVRLSKDFNQKMMTAIAVSLVLAVFGLISFVLFRKFKKQKNMLAKANAEVKKVNEHLEDMVAKRTQQLLESNNELDTFLYRSSHDLRSPLTTIVGLSNIARLTLDQQSYELFDRASNTAKQMDKMLSKLIAVNQIHHPSTYCSINFESQVNESVSHFGELIAKRRVSIKKSIQPGIQYQSHPEVVEIILKCLLENAIWFSSIEETNGRAKVALNITQANGNVSISMEDNGPGIDENIRPRIWEMFFVGHQESAGNGLGLYLVQKAVKVLEGTIELKPSNGITVFEINLPVNGN